MTNERIEPIKEKLLKEHGEWAYKQIQLIGSIIGMTPGGLVMFSGDIGLGIAFIIFGGIPAVVISNQKKYQLSYILKFKSGAVEQMVLEYEEAQERAIKEKERAVDALITRKQNERLALEKKRQEEEKRVLARIKEEEAIDKSLNTLFNLLDDDNNGIVDEVEAVNHFEVLLSKNQTDVSSIDRSYIDHFVMLSEFIDEQAASIKLQFDYLKSVNHRENKSWTLKMVKELSNTLHETIGCYKVTKFNALRMLSSLLDNDMITFYKIYRSFDKVNVFDSQWQRDVKNKLDLANVLHYAAIEQMAAINKNITQGLEKLTLELFSLREDISNLGTDLQLSLDSLDSRLEDIDAGVTSNTMLNGIQTYQLYKINNKLK